MLLGLPATTQGRPMGSPGPVPLSLILIWRQKWGLGPIPAFHTHLPSGETKCPDFCDFHTVTPSGLRPRRVCLVGFGWEARPRRARLAGIKCLLLRRKEAGAGRRVAHPRGASLRSSAGNVGRVPPVQYVWINIVSLGQHAGFANCASAGAAGPEGVLGHQDLPRLPTLALR